MLPIGSISLSAVPWVATSNTVKTMAMRNQRRKNLRRAAEQVLKGKESVTMLVP